MDSFYVYIFLFLSLFLFFCYRQVLSRYVNVVAAGRYVRR